MTKLKASLAKWSTCLTVRDHGACSVGPLEWPNVGRARRLARRKPVLGSANAWVPIDTDGASKEFDVLLVATYVCCRTPQDKQQAMARNAEPIGFGASSGASLITRCSERCLRCRLREG